MEETGGVKRFLENVMFNWYYKINNGIKSCYHRSGWKSWGNQKENQSLTIERETKSSGIELLLVIKKEVGYWIREGNEKTLDSIWWKSSKNI